LDAPAIAYFLGLGYWLISKVRVISHDRARDSIDLVAASVDASLGIVEHAIFGEDLVNRSAPTRRVVLTEDIVKTAGQSRGTSWPRSGTQETGQARCCADGEELSGSIEFSM
jgi:hypothetical protein